MNFYEHTLITRQDISPSQIKQIQEKYTKIIENNDGDNIYVVKAAPVPVGSSLVVVGGDQKVVLEASDVLKVTSDTASSADVSLSILEIT